MKEIGLSLGVLLISINCIAASTSLNSHLQTAFLKHSVASSQSADSTIIYGGQDISRSIIANADQRSDQKQSTMVV